MTDHTTDTAATEVALHPIVSVVVEHALRLIMWAWCGFCLLLWDSHSVWCWIFCEGFAIAAGVFIGMPCFYAHKLWRALARANEKLTSGTGENAA